MDAPTARRIAQNQVTFRRVNEALEPDSGAATYVCECGRLGCTETIGLSRGDYEAIRTGFTLFFVLPGHQVPCRGSRA